MALAEKAAFEAEGLLRWLNRIRAKGEVETMLADPKVDFVKTLAVMADPVHPHWKQSVEASIVINLCVRRRCHELIGGFPDYHLVVREGASFRHQIDLPFKIEDMFYNRILREVFRGARLAKETVEYVRHPGNAYDKQYEKFRRPPGEYHLKEDEEFLLRHKLSQTLVEYHIQRLKRTIRPSG